MSETKSREWLLYNAVLAWIHNYGKLDDTLAEQYASLRKELEFEYEQPENTETRKRGRPAKRQRTSKASSNSSSTEKNQTTNQEA